MSAPSLRMVSKFLKQFLFNCINLEIYKLVSSKINYNFYSSWRDRCTDIFSCYRLLFKYHLVRKFERKDGEGAQDFTKSETRNKSSSKGRFLRSFQVSLEKREKFSNFDIYYQNPICRNSETKKSCKRQNSFLKMNHKSAERRYQ